MNADLAWTHLVRLDPSWDTNPDSTTLLWTCQTCEGLSLPPPWLEQTDEKCVAGKPTEHTGKQELDRCWSGRGLESPFSDSALPCQPQRQDLRACVRLCLAVPLPQARDNRHRHRQTHRQTQTQTRSESMPNKQNTNSNRSCSWTKCST